MSPICSSISDDERSCSRDGNEDKTKYQQQCSI
jgi:hypothetical protein